MASSAIRMGMSADRVAHFTDAAAAAKALPQNFAQGDLVLLKASRGIKLEQVAAQVAAQTETAQTQTAQTGRSRSRRKLAG